MSSTTTEVAPAASPTSVPPPPILDTKKNTIEQTTVPTSTLKKEDDPSIAPPAKEAKSMTFTLSPTHTLYLMWFLMVYFTLYALVSVLVPGAQDGVEKLISRTVDTIFGTILVIIIACGAYVLSPEEKYALLDEFGSFVESPVSVFPVSLFLFILYLCTHILRIPRGENKPFVIGSVENIGWLLFVVTFSQSVSKYVFDIDLFSAVRRFANKNFGQDNTNTASAQHVPSDGKEVFNVSDNIYTYDDAKGVCSALGARLATYEEVEKAYNKGAEWCNYGWSEGGMALFPTQKKTWDALQTSPETSNACGRPGINGGVMDKGIRFGANCYGKRPPQPANFNKDACGTPKTPSVTPLTANDRAVAERAEYYKTHASEIAAINGFNDSKWSGL